ncbi:hypothetical protein FACS1894139_00540 [Planctomycetales bacterium]|nr:hypothetical protein FACS1894107_01410 [Planctomycetales bacterium]GHS99363.1 hypothetical protein FACS1894108_09210 [Planctomycetales bacterium]GHT02422.1 hypothetical protein FACS1894139_00540 [Planctomycetales bacterium]
MNNPDQATRAIVAPVGDDAARDPNPERGSTNSSTPSGLWLAVAFSPSYAAVAAPLGVIHIKPLSGLLAELMMVKSRNMSY